MDTRLGGAERSYKVRGNLFSFLLPWEEVVRQLREQQGGGDLAQWPWSPEVRIAKQTTPKHSVVRRSRHCWICLGIVTQENPPVQRRRIIVCFVILIGYVPDCAGKIYERVGMLVR